MKFLTRNPVIIFTGILMLASLLGMVIFKQKLELNDHPMDEFYFNLFRSTSIAIVIFFAFEWLSKRWQEFRMLRNDKLNAELSNLKNQISPHFFFNTLNTLYGLIKKDQDAAQSYVLKLSNLMRYNIYQSNDGLVPIEREIEHLENFIDLNKIRYKKKVEIDFQKNIEDENYSIHPLLLIVPLENAFKHGVETSTDRAFVRIELEVKNDNLSYSVENNFESISQKVDGGFGLQNLESRLDLLYPDHHDLETLELEDVFVTKLSLRP